jgi:hypothetical protein
MIARAGCTKVLAQAESFPQGLKPGIFGGVFGTAKAVPLQKRRALSAFIQLKLRRFDTPLVLQARGFVRFPASRSEAVLEAGQPHPVSECGVAVCVELKIGDAGDAVAVDGAIDVGGDEVVAPMERIDGAGLE